MDMTVLVVDDDAAVAEFCRRTLVESGCPAVVAHSGRQALAALEQTEIDLVLSDVRMPDIDGVALLRAITPGRRGPDVVLMTGYASVPSAVEAIRLGAYDYIVKPFSPDQLLAVIHRMNEVRALRTENELLRFRLGSENGLGGLVGESPAMVEVFTEVLRIAPRHHPVLITGETGTGKELIARAIHTYGQSAAQPFVAVDCGALPESLVESEVFGHVRGAFTGAAADRVGLLAAAANGTLFLDEVGELAPDLQAKFFRVLQEREFRSLGSDTIRRFEARVIAATSRDVETALHNGTLRPELYYRLNVHHVHMPPLRTRKSDLQSLVRHFLRKHGENRVVAIDPRALEALLLYDWPGNVRELENCVLSMVANCDGPILDSGDLPRAIAIAVRARPAAGSTLHKAERDAIQETLAACGGDVVEAARRLEIAKATLYRKMRRYGLRAQR